MSFLGDPYLDPFGGEFGGFWRCLSYLDPFHVYLDPFMFT